MFIGVRLRYLFLIILLLIGNDGPNTSTLPLYVNVCSRDIKGCEVWEYYTGDYPGEYMSEINTIINVYHKTMHYLY